MMSAEIDTAAHFGIFFRCIHRINGINKSAKKMEEIRGMKMKDNILSR